MQAVFFALPAILLSVLVMASDLSVPDFSTEIAAWSAFWPAIMQQSGDRGSASTLIGRGTLGKQLAMVQL